jgi:rod shape determining protein RodA
MIQGRLFRQYDYILLAACAALIAYGLILIYSASFTEVSGPGFAGASPVTRQFVFAVLGTVGMLVASRIDYHAYRRFAVPLYVGAILALMSVFVIGTEVYGSRRWISVGGTEVQPSELAKLVLVLVLAKYLSDRRDRIQTPRVFITSLGIAIPPLVLVLMQPDLGSATVFGCIWLGMVIVAGASSRHIGIFFATLTMLLPFAFIVAVTDYQKERIALFFDPQSDPLGGGFSIIQAEIGIGSGGLFGKGLTEGLQTQNDLVNSQTTDYIFSIVAEELGFVGALVLFALFMVFLFRVIRAAGAARDSYGEMIAVGMVVMVLAQVFINIAVNVRIFPVTGLPLPFISQGGSSLVTLMAGVGIIQSIRVRRGRQGHAGAGASSLR